MATQTMGTMFPAEIVSDLFNKVQGKSSLAKLAEQKPVAFRGNDIFTFSMDNEINVVGEGAAHAAGGITVAPVQVRPVKVEYGARVSEEFMHAADEVQLDYLRDFNDGFARKVARGLDIMAIHGLNPRTNASATQITKFLDQGTKTVEYTANSGDANIEAAVALLADYDNTGVAIDKTMSADLAKENTKGIKHYPELAWGGQPDTLNGIPCSVNSTISVHATSGATDHAIVGDFANYFKWGFGKDISMEIIPYGDPDNSGKDLKGNGEVYIRAQAYIGWGIMDQNAFARVITAAAGG